MLALVFSALGEENSAQRLENAQRGIAEASWPKKPDNRLSPLSGKMRESREISVSYFGKEKEVQAKTAEGWQKHARTQRTAGWDQEAGHSWQKELWSQNRHTTSGEARHKEFQPDKDLGPKRTVTFRALEREREGDWSSRSARLGSGRDGSLRMYEGRLTRVRQQVWQEEPSPRDLGPGRQEKYSPEEVEKMLSRPIGESRGAAKEQSPGAFPLATADN